MSSVVVSPSFEIGRIERGDRRQGEHLVASQGLEEGLHAAPDEAADRVPVDLDIGHAGRPFDLAGWRGGDEGDLHSP